MRRYEVDAAMLGPEWRGTSADLVEFCHLLQARCETHGLRLHILPVTSSENGARNDDPDLLPEEIWNQAVDASPAEWWR